MAKKKVKRWRSRPADKNGSTYATYRKPEGEKVYKIKGDSPKKEPSELQKQYAEQKQKEHASKAPQHKKSKYKSAPASRPEARTVADKDRIREQHAKVRKRNNVVFRACVACGFLVIAMVVCIFIFFKIGEIQVTGSEKYKASQIVEASGVELGDNLYAPTALSVQNKLSEKLPYIQSVTLKHQLPDVLIICVKETTAEFAFESKNETTTKYILTDHQLKFLEVADEPPKNAAVIEGAGIKNADIGKTAEFKEAEKGEIIRNIKKAFKENDIDNITKIDISNIIDIQVVFNDAITIELGQDNALDYKCKLAAKAIADAQKDNEDATGVINVKQADKTKQAYFNPNS